MDIEQVLVDSTTLLTMDLAPGGGQAVRFYPASAEEQAALQPYTP